MTPPISLSFCTSLVLYYVIYNLIGILGDSNQTIPTPWWDRYHNRVSKKTQHFCRFGSVSKPGRCMTIGKTYYLFNSSWISYSDRIDALHPTASPHTLCESCSRHSGPFAVTAHLTPRHYNSRYFVYNIYPTRKSRYYVHGAKWKTGVIGWTGILFQTWK